MTTLDITIAPPRPKVTAITEADVQARSQEDKLIEISRGQWEESTIASPEHGRIGMKVGALIFNHATTNQLGEVYGADTTYVLEGSPGKVITMRLPDVSFVKAERVQRVAEGYYYLAPDLAVEIISSTERPGKVAQKLQDYLKAGVQQAWLIYPKDQEVLVYTPDGHTAVYGIEDSIPGGDLLPNFSLPVKTIFA